MVIKIKNIKGFEMKIIQHGIKDCYRYIVLGLILVLPTVVVAETELMQPVEDVHFAEIAPPWLSTPISKTPISKTPVSKMPVSKTPTRKQVIQTPLPQVREKAKSQVANHYQPQNFSINSLQATAKQGNVNSQYQLGMRYQYGDGVSKSQSKAHLWLEKSARAGYVKSQHALSQFYQQYAKNAAGVKKALLWEKRAADKGFADAQYSLGMMFQNGSLVNKNAAEAKIWLKKAARQGHVPAQLALR